MAIIERMLLMSYRITRPIGHLTHEGDLKKGIFLLGTIYCYFGYVNTTININQMIDNCRISRLIGYLLL